MYTSSSILCVWVSECLETGLNCLHQPLNKFPNSSFLIIYTLFIPHPHTHSPPTY